MHERVERAVGDQRHVAEQHEHGMVVGYRRQRLGNRMTGTELLGLLAPDEIGIGKRCANRLAAVPVDDLDIVCPELPGPVDDVRQHRLAGQRLQDLGQLRMHSLALAGSQDHDR